MNSNLYIAKKAVFHAGIAIMKVYDTAFNAGIKDDKCSEPTIEYIKQQESFLK